jgi:sarcosine oxidase gamma subunit
MHYTVQHVPPNEWQRIAREHANAAPTYLPRHVQAEMVGRRTACVQSEGRTVVYVEADDR